MIDKLLQESGPEIMTPAMPREIVAELARSPHLAEYREELVQAKRFQMTMALLRQRKIAEANERIEWAFVEGLGMKVATIDPELYHQMELLYGKGCWRDKEFLADTLKKSPHLRIRCQPRKLSLRVNGQRDVGSNIGTRAGASHATQRASDAARLRGEPAGPIRLNGDRRSGHETAGTSSHSKRLELATV